ncbi:MAG: guanylyl cyclase, partial [Alphaproteobacteria bacterium]|nr:guanylyl cyclase [Alphaproteobacteria bacterium]
MSFDLFAHEESVIAHNRALVDAEGRDAQAARVAFSELLKNYERLFKATRRLVRISDRTEAELSALAEKQRLTNAEIAKKNRELEILSSKLAKYLSPQVYRSIFTGAQEVQLASQRKKLTVFFSDIANFTELTDLMESEDLTHLLNHYLTEMSKVALEY